MPLTWGPDFRHKLKENARALAFVGLVNTALPMGLFAFAILYLPAGFSSVLNATAPYFGVLVAAFWLKEKFTGLNFLGLLLGALGVYLLVAHRLAMRVEGAALAIAAGLLSTFCYGVGANAAKHYLSKLPSLYQAAGSQIFAAFFLALLLPFQWPEKNPAIEFWFYALALGIFCTGLAYIIYFRLIARLGASGASSVTFLIPLFGLLWGAIFLEEKLTLKVLISACLILLGMVLLNKKTTTS